MTSAIFARDMTRQKPDPRQETTTDFGFRQVPVSEKPGMVDDVFARVATRYDLMNDFMSAGVHRLWKRALIDHINPRPGMRLLDVAGGTGDIAMRFLARAREKGRDGAPQAKAPPAKALVCDRNEAMVRVGRDRALNQNRLSGIRWITGDAESLPVASASVDAYTISFGLRNVTGIDNALREAARVLVPGGHFLCLEFSHVILPRLAELYDAYSFRVIPLLGEWIAKDREAYRYLVESIRCFPTQDALSERIRAAGLDCVSVRNLSGGIAAIHSAWRI